MKNSISTFFPALNEEGSIAKLTEDLLKILNLNFEYHEVIIINDGSTDQTRHIADELLSKHNGHVRRRRS